MSGNSNPNEIDEFKSDIVRAVMAGLKPEKAEAVSKPRWTEMVQTVVPAVALLTLGIGGWINLSNQVQQIATVQINRATDITTNSNDLKTLAAKETAVEERVKVVEYQNTTSLEDRKDLREKLSQTNAQVSSIGDRLTRIEAGVQQLLEQRKGK